MTRRKRPPSKPPGAIAPARLSKAALAAMIEEATVDAHDELEQATGWFTMFEEHLELPFETKVLGAVVTVASIDLRDSGQLNAICKHGRDRQAISLVELPLPTPRPAGSEWIEAYCHWLGLRPKFVTVHTAKEKAPAEPRLSSMLPASSGSANPTASFVIDLAEARKHREPAKLVLPRVCQMLALADQYQRELDTEVVNRRSDLAKLHGVSKPRITQLLDLHRLHPDILDYIRGLKIGQLLRPTTEKKLRAWVELAPAEQLKMAEKDVQGFGDFQKERSRARRQRA